MCEESDSKALFKTDKMIRGQILNVLASLSVERCEHFQSKKFLTGTCSQHEVFAHTCVALTNQKNH